MTKPAIERPWIQRRLANQLYDRIIHNDGSLTVFFVEASAGIGKTFLARDIGTRLGSPTGYEPRRQGNIIWSGILDIYDPDTNSGHGVERRLIEAFQSTGVDAGAFEEYYDKRATFESWRRTGIVGASLEDHRRKVERAFADSLKGIAAQQRLTLVFDTVERLEHASDSTQQTSGYYSDTTFVAGWLIDQIIQLNNGVVLLFGRHSQNFCSALQAAIERANLTERVNSPIEYHIERLSELDDEEIDQFFQRRKEQSADLRDLLNTELEGQMASTIGGNPLLLDLAILSLQENHDPVKLTHWLSDSVGMQEVERALIAGYKNSLKRPEHAKVLHYLALARNGLSAELLHALDPAASNELIAALKQMETLPFVKARDITWTDPNHADANHADVIRHRVYFLHDAMYTIYDGAVLKPVEAQIETKRILKVYERWIAHLHASLRSVTREDDRETLKRAFEDVRVESLFYRMRSDLVEGYHWYLKQTDRAIRNSEIGYDMRLQNELGMFLVSAGIGNAGEVGESLRSPIDQANVAAQFPELVSHFQIDSASSLVKRLTMRGKTRQAVAAGEAMLPALKSIFEAAPTIYGLAYAEILLWLGQAIMYGLDNQRALTLYRQIVDKILCKPQSDDAESSSLGNNEFSAWRHTMVLGRTYNNMGYVNWLYLGCFTLAIQQLQHARALFLRTEHDDPSIEEELANASDNLGRVYAQLGKEFQSLRLIRNGLKIRERLGSSYRTALSQVSLAHAYLRMGDYEQGLLAAEKALVSFKRMDVQRGIGLGLLVRGMLYRNRAEAWRERNVSAQSALDDVDKAETDLRDAVRIFSSAVGEPIRAVQAHNELGCCYRARYLILQKSAGGSGDRDFAYAQARLQLREAIKVAEANNLYIERLDTLQDMAVLYVRAGQYDEALRYLQQVSDAIDQVHQIVDGKGLAKLGDDERVDAYYKLMGQVKLLTGAIQYEQGRQHPNSDISENDMPDNETIVSSAHEYLLAVTYFREFGEEDLALRQTYERIYKRFQYCQPELMQEITKQHIPAWVDKYNLPQSLVIGLFQDVFPLLLD